MKNRIHQIEASGLKGKTFRHELAPVTCFIGDNDAGKTARLDAIQLALAGVTTSLRTASGECAKTNKAIFSAFGCGAAELRVCAVLEGGQILTRTWKESGAGSVTGTVSMPVHVIDPQEYFRLSGGEKMRMIFRLAQIDPAESSGEAIAARVKNLKFEDNTEETEKFLTERASEASQAAKPGATIQEWIGALLENWKGKYKEAKAAFARLDGMIQGLAEMRATASGPAPVNVENDLKVARFKLNEISNKAFSLNREIEEAGQKHTRKLQIEEMLKRATDNTEEIAELQAKVGKLRGQCAGYTPRAEKLAADLRILESEQKNDQKFLLEKQAELEELNKAIEKADGTCPTCGCKSKARREEIEKKLKADLASIEKAIAKVAPEVKSRAKKIPTLQKDLEKATAEDSKKAALREELDAAQDHLSELQTDSARAAELRGELEALRIKDTAQMREEHAALINEQTTASTKISELEQKQREFLGNRGKQSQIAESEKRIAVVKAENAVMKAAVDLLEEIQGEMVTKAIGRILERANRIAAPLMPYPLEIRAGEIGSSSKGVFYPFNAFGQKSQIATCAGLSIALAAEAPFRLVLIDEAGRMDKEYKAKLLKLAPQLIKDDVIDQLILTDNDPTGYADSPDYSCIKI